MTIYDAINKDLEVGTYLIGFQNDDETTFFAEDLRTLEHLWHDFCKENNLPTDCVNYVYLNQSAPSILSEYLEETGASIAVTAEGWWVEDYENGCQTFHSWAEMIQWMDEQNDAR